MARVVAATLSSPSREGLLALEQGADLLIRKTISFSGFAFPTGETITAAWLTVKRSRSDADPGVFQKQISTTDVSGTGQIETDGTGDVDMVVRFDINAADTLLLDERPVRWEIKLKTASGDFDIPETGLCWARRYSTTDTS